MRVYPSGGARGRRYAGGGAAGQRWCRCRVASGGGGRGRPGRRAHTWKNLNLLLTRYSGAIGIKTGFTAAAGQCLLFAARRGSKTLIGVVLHSSSSVTDLSAAVNDAIRMLSYGFSR
jgi:hypothetical protein